MLARCFLPGSYSNRCSGFALCNCRPINIPITRQCYPLLQMRPATLHLLCLSGLLAMACTAGAQSASAPRTQGTQAKTVHFDGSSTAALVLQARGKGVQIYTCMKNADWSWKLKAPEATLFDQHGKAIGKHFAGPSWRLNDGSEVQGKVLEVRQQPGTIPWLILAVHSTGGPGSPEPCRCCATHRYTRRLSSIHWMRRNPRRRRGARSLFGDLQLLRYEEIASLPTEHTRSLNDRLCSRNLV